MAFRPCCVDLYHGNIVNDKPSPLIGLTQMAGDGIAFLIHKATEGLSERDQCYDTRRAHWSTGAAVVLVDVDGKTVTVPRKFGAYHFLHGADEKSAMLEARRFTQVARIEAGDEPFVDWETVGRSYAPSAAIADAFCKTVEDALGRHCWVYSGNVAREQLAHATTTLIDSFAARPLWFCEYGKYDHQRLPIAWLSTGPTLWQDDGDTYGPGPHHIPGVQGVCDNSTVVAPMTISKLASLWGTSHTITKDEVHESIWQHAWNELRIIA